MTAKREALARWKYPTSDLLMNRAFASDKPPFAPFPTVTNLMNASLCPVAIYHDLLHGQDNALVGGWDSAKRGDLFSGFVSHLKYSIKSEIIALKGDRQNNRMQISSLFSNYAHEQNYPDKATADLWKAFISPWIERKLDSGELHEISSTNQLFFEMTLANAKTPFPYEQGVRNYPLTGRVDEIDVTNKRIIERTIKGNPDSESPPRLKDYQVWLYKRILCSLSENQKPIQWKNVDFTKFELRVETPFADYSVEDNDRFLEDTHSAYAWISDISTSESRGAFREVFQNQACAPESPNEYCAFPFITCFHKRYSYPRAKPEMRQIVQPWFRMLLWEQMWSGHLWRYKALMLERDELLKQGMILESKIIGKKDGLIELELMDQTAATLRGYEYCTIIPFGTMSCGINLSARLIKTEDNRVFLNIRNRMTDLSEKALLLISTEGVAPMSHEPPNFLQRRNQNELFWLNNSGTEDSDKANKESSIQLIEAVFGTRPLRRDRE